MPRRKNVRRVLTKRSAALEGLPELADKLSDILEAIDSDDVYELLMDGAKTLRDEAKDLAPFGATRKRGVHLRDAIFAAEGDPSKDARGPNVIAGVNRRADRGAPHAHLVERGTARMPARPFWRPAIAATRPAIANIYSAGLRRIISDAAK